MSDDHLLPTESALHSSADMTAYLAKLRETLGRLHHGSFWNHLLLRVMVRPAFTAEYALSIERKTQQPYLVYTASQVNIWRALQREPAVVPVVESCAVPISSVLAEAVCQAVRAAVDQTRYPRGGVGVVLDGTQYDFAIDGRGGHTHSPSGGSMAALTDLTEALCLAARQDAGAEAEPALLARAQQLLAGLSAPVPMSLATTDHQPSELAEITSTKALLEKIRARPALYIGYKSLTRLHWFLQGWNTAHLVHAWADQQSETFWEDFQIWVEQQWGRPGNNSWASIIDFGYGGHPESSFDAFFRLYDEFVALRASGAARNLSRD